MRACKYISIKCLFFLLRNQQQNVPRVIANWGSSYILADFLNMTLCIETQHEQTLSHTRPWTQTDTQMLHIMPTLSSFIQLTGDIESYSGHDEESVQRPFQDSTCQSSRHPSFIMWRWPDLKLSTDLSLSVCNTALLLAHPAQTCCAAKELKEPQKHWMKQRN